jgi:hypothetical protein
MAQPPAPEAFDAQLADEAEAQRLTDLNNALSRLLVDDFGRRIRGAVRECKFEPEDAEFMVVQALSALVHMEFSRIADGRSLEARAGVREPIRETKKTIAAALEWTDKFLTALSCDLSEYGNIKFRVLRVDDPPSPPKSRKRKEPPAA